jgi:hypothetical protein
MIAVPFPKTLSKLDTGSPKPNFTVGFVTLLIVFSQLGSQRMPVLTLCIIDIDGMHMRAQLSVWNDSAAVLKADPQA